MYRTNFAQRPDYVKRLEELGFSYWNLPSGPLKKPYWSEGACYVFKESEIDAIQAATQELHFMCLDMVDQIVTSGDYPEYFKLNNLEKGLIEQSWKDCVPSLYGRFDLVYKDPKNIKMLEINGDTPVSILECSVAQWNYIQEAEDIPDNMRIQYNMVHETLIERWKEMFPQGTKLHFAAAAGFRHEDWGNLIYLMETAVEAGMICKDMNMQDIGVTAEGQFVDLQDQPIENIFKLYPWEWMVDEEFSKYIPKAATNWLEPAWKMMLSNKAMLVKLWELNKGHDLLLPSYFNESELPDGTWCKKAIHGREGSNIHKVVRNFGTTVSDDIAQGSHKVPEYDKWGYMYQQWHDLPVHDGYKPILGSWVIGDKACGMSVREDPNDVTGNDAHFACHVFIPEE